MPQEDREGSQANAIAPYRLEVHVARWPDRLAKLRLGFPRAVPSWRETRDVSAKDDLVRMLERSHSSARGHFMGRQLKRVARLVEVAVALAVLGLAAGEPTVGQTIATTCTARSLSEYEALQPPGCSVADLRFSDFLYSSSGVAPSASQITVTPRLAPSDAGLLVVEVTFTPTSQFSPNLHSVLTVAFNASTQNDVRVTQATLSVRGAELVFATFDGPGFDLGAFAGPPSFSGQQSLTPPVPFSGQPLTTGVSLTLASARINSWTIALATTASTSLRRLTPKYSEVLVRRTISAESLAPSDAPQEVSLP